MSFMEARTQIRAQRISGVQSSRAPITPFYTEMIVPPFHRSAAPAMGSSKMPSPQLSI